MSERKQHGVRIVRAADQRAEREAGGGRATVFSFTGDGGGGGRTWIGTVTLKPGGSTGGHHHGRHEVAIYVISGHADLSWGEGLSSSAQVGPGDFAHFSPDTPHQERNLSESESVEFLVVRSDNERIAVPWED